MIEDEILRKLELGNKILKKVSLVQSPFSKSRKNIITLFKTPRYIKRQNEKCLSSLYFFKIRINIHLKLCEFYVKMNTKKEPLTCLMLNN